MNWRPVYLIACKDWIELRQNKYAWIPMLIIPVIFIVLLPIIFTVILPALQVSPEEVLSSDTDIQFFVDRMPASMRSYIDFGKPMESMIVIMLGFLFAPMFLIMPLMYSATIAAESFAGERERKTIEALLYTPASDAELMAGKVAASAVPAVGITWIGFAVYTIILNVLPFQFFGRIWFPLPIWWPLIFWISPALIFLGIAVTVLISARVPNFLGAYQMSASLVLLVVLLFAGQITGVLYLSVGLGLLIGAVFWIIAAAVGYFAVKTFNRRALLSGNES